MRPCQSAFDTTNLPPRIANPTDAHFTNTSPTLPSDHNVPFRTFRSYPQSTTGQYTQTTLHPFVMPCKPYPRTKPQKRKAQIALQHKRNIEPNLQSNFPPPWIQLPTRHAGTCRRLWVGCSKPGLVTLIDVVAHGDSSDAVPRLLLRRTAKVYRLSEMANGASPTEVRSQISVRDERESALCFPNMWRRSEYGGVLNTNSSSREASDQVDFERVVYILISGGDDRYFHEPGFGGYAGCRIGRLERRCAQLAAFLNLGFSHPPYEACKRKEGRNCGFAGKKSMSLHLYCIERFARKG
ncbi:hypothetical protein SVAN01_07568 [Stagonosporopsis vannaccii]|nr:hypothetical protein SVAN01_07568 [Stagonosporopsis vannaccii]